MHSRHLCSDRRITVDKSLQTQFRNFARNSKGGELRDTKTLNLWCNIVSLQVLVDVSRFSPCMINLSGDKIKHLLRV